MSVNICPGQSLESGYDFPFIAFSSYCSSQASVFLRPYACLVVDVSDEVEAHMFDGGPVCGSVIGPQTHQSVMEDDIHDPVQPACCRQGGFRCASGREPRWQSAWRKAFADERKSRRSVEVFPSRRTSASILGSLVLSHRNMQRGRFVCCSDRIFKARVLCKLGA